MSEKSLIGYVKPVRVFPTFIESIWRTLHCGASSPSGAVYSLPCSLPS